MSEIKEVFGSSWLVTVNSQQPVDYGNQKLFESIIKNLVLSKNLLNFFSWKEDADGEFDHNPPFEEILRISDDFSVIGNVEIGDIHGKVHSHFTINYFHFEYVQFNNQKLKRYIIEKSKGKIVPNIKWKPNPLPPGPRRYLLKTIGETGEFSVHNKLYIKGQKSMVFNEEVEKP